MDWFYSQGSIFQASIISVLGVIFSCIINNWLVNRKISADRESLEKTLENNRHKIKADLFAQSSKTYKELITSERIKWIGSLRESTSEYLSKTYYLHMLKHTQFFEPEDKEFINSPILPEIYKLAYLIKLHLNPTEIKNIEHKELVKYLDEINDIINNFIMNETNERDPDLNDMYFTIKKIDLCCQQLLKKEWDKVKEEAEKLYK